MLSNYQRPLLALIVCLLSVWIYGGRSGARELASTRPSATIIGLVVKPTPPHKTAEAPVKIVQAVPAPPLEPLNWQGPVEPMAVAPGSVPVISRVSTTEPVVFLGIDDGWYQTPDALNWLTSHKLPFTMFLENDAIKNNYDYFRQLQNAGLSVEDHTLSHPDLTKLSLRSQEYQICGAADTYASVFGRRPTLFRPPYGAYNSLTVQAAAACGMQALVMWHADVNGGQVLFQDGNQQLLPGDIVLMHFRPEFAADIQAFSDELSKDHLQVAKLEDWLR